MTQTEKHTPTNVSISLIDPCHVIEKTHDIIETNNGRGGTESTRLIAIASNPEHAAFIVKAVNSHAKLLAALKFYANEKNYEVNYTNGRMADGSEDIRHDSIIEQDEGEQANAAIADAEGTTP